MNERIEEILRNPSVMKTAEGDGYTDDTASKWAWFAHGYDTGMEPFYSIDQIRDAVRSVLAEPEQCRPGSVCSRSIRGLGGCEAGSCEREEGAGGVTAAPASSRHDHKCDACGAEWTWTDRTNPRGACPVCGNAGVTEVQRG